MSLFRAREWWHARAGPNEEFDMGSMCIANIDGDTSGARGFLMRDDLPHGVCMLHAPCILVEPLACRMHAVPHPASPARAKYSSSIVMQAEVIGLEKRCAYTTKHIYTATCGIAKWARGMHSSNRPGYTSI